MRTFFNPGWSHPANVLSVQSLRAGGFSTAPFDTLNLGVFSADPQATKNLQHLAHNAALPHVPRFMRQTHSDTVIELTRQCVQADHGFTRGDACFTRQPGVVCGVLTADCLPILLSDHAGTVVAAIHAGWRGLFSGIIAKTIQAMAATGLSAWIGPGIGYAHYVVSADFRQRFVDRDPACAPFFYWSEKQQQWHADLKRLAKHQLVHAGVTDIAASPLCTYANPDLFFSYRRDHQRLGDTGRHACFIWIDMP